MDEAKKIAEKFYVSIGEISCPYFNEKVSFNAKGLDHIKFKDFSKSRTKLDQYVRLRLIKLAPQVIARSHTLQDYYETRKFERRKINQRWEKQFVLVKYFGFVAIINDCRVKIIVKEIQGGKKFFWSIIPFWKMKATFNQSKNAHENKKILHDGDLETE